MLPDYQDCQFCEHDYSDWIKSKVLKIAYRDVGHSWIIEIAKTDTFIQRHNR